jgi:hypothetical protein
MKGIIFTEFIEMVERTYGFEMTDRIIIGVDPPSKGIYTAVGQYRDDELYSLIDKLAELTHSNVPDLIRSFGMALFPGLKRLHPEFVDAMSNVFDLLENINDHIHYEVKKLYPDAQLPRVDCDREGNERMTVRYHSHRPLGDLAEGLIRAVIHHFQESIEVDRQDQDSVGSHVNFYLRRFQ